MNIIRNSWMLMLALLLIGCAGTKTFHEVARPGDTVAVAAGYRHDFQRDNITVTVTDSSGATTTYAPGDLAVRGAVNFYPDPLSSWVVSDRTGVSQTPNALTYAGQNLFQNTSGDYDWWQTVVFVDLPVTMGSPVQPMAAGNATILIETPAGPDQEVHSATVNIVAGAGKTHNFNAITKDFGIPFYLEDQHVQALERVPNVTLDFSGSDWSAYTLPPYAIQVDLSHDPDESSGGAAGAKAYVANPVGHIKSVNWHDDGINTRIILLPNRGTDITDFKDFKLYLAGITGWTVVATQVFDVNGAPVEPNDVVATVN